MKNQENAITLDNNTTVYKFKDMEFYDLDNKELKIPVLRNLMHYKKTQRKFNDVRTTIYAQNEKFNAEIKITKRTKQKFWR